MLLTTTLEPGVTFVGSSVTLDGTTTAQLPDQSGQNLAWSLAPIQGYDRESVALTVNLPALSTVPRPRCDRHRAQAYATLDAGAVSATTPAATLQPGNVSDPSLLASTVDADTNDPFIQEEAAALGLRSAEHLQLPAHADRLQLVPRLDPRRAGHALVERGQRARRRQPGRGPDARLGHPGAVRRGHAVAERRPRS